MLFKKKGEDKGEDKEWKRTERKSNGPEMVEMKAK